MLSSPPPARLLSIPSGEAGVTATLKLMAQIARQYCSHPLIRQSAADLVNQCAPHDQECEVATLQAWVQNNIRYIHDVDEVETLQTPDYTLQHGYGDCDDQSILMASMLLSIGIKAAYVAIGIEGGPFSHVLPVAILRQHDRVLHLPCETTMTRDPKTGVPITLGWFPVDATSQKFFHV